MSTRENIRLIARAPLPNSSVIIESYGNLLNLELKIGTFHMYVISQ